MSLPIVRGEVDFYSERFTGKPYDNCQICVAMTVARWAGYDVPDGYDDVIRKAAGVPDPQGTNTAEVMRGLAALGISLTAGDVDEQFMLDNLKAVGGRGAKKAVFAVVIQTGKLPTHFQRLVGQGYDGLHGIAIVAKSAAQVYILDPMGRTAPPKGAPPAWQPYIGELIAWTDLAPALQRTPAGLLKDAIYAYKNTAT